MKEPNHDITPQEQMAEAMQAERPGEAQPAAVIKNVSWAEALGINAARGETPAELASAVKEAILK